MPPQALKAQRKRVEGRRQLGSCTQGLCGKPALIRHFKDGRKPRVTVYCEEHTLRNRKKTRDWCEAIPLPKRRAYWAANTARWTKRQSSATLRRLGRIRHNQWIAITTPAERRAYWHAQHESRKLRRTPHEHVD